MIVGVDLRPLATSHVTGVEGYLVSLLDTLTSLDDSISYKLFLSGATDIDLDSYSFVQRSNVELVRVPVPNKILNLSFAALHQPSFEQLLGEVDVFFMPNILFAGSSSGLGLCVTFHDLSFEHFADCLSLKRRLWHKFVGPEKLAQEADHVITVSQSTKEDLISTYSLDESRVSVAPSSVVFEKKAEVNVRKKYSLPEKYILILGTVEPRKNIAAAISAFMNLREDFSEYSLVVAGVHGWDQELFLGKSITELQKHNILFTGYIDEQDKYLVYENASLFLYPTLFEGFGFPLVEAARASVPIISTAHSSIFEVIGNGALLCDPFNVVELRDLIEIVLGSEEMQEKLVRRAKKHVEQYSLQATANETLSVLRKVYEHAKAR